MVSKSVEGCLVPTYVTMCLRSCVSKKMPPFGGINMEYEFSVAAHAHISNNMPEAVSAKKYAID